MTPSRESRSRDHWRLSVNGKDIEHPAAKAVAVVVGLPAVAIALVAVLIAIVACIAAVPAMALAFVIDKALRGES
jgi:hypothetical protein